LLMLIKDFLNSFSYYFLLIISGVSISTVLTTVLPAYTIADPVTSTTAIVVEQAFKNNATAIIDKNLFIY